MSDQTGGGGRESRVLDAEVLSFDLRREGERLQREEAWRIERRNAITLMKGPRLRVVLEAMQAGTRMHAPHADGAVTLLPLSGRIALHAGQQRREAGPWDLLSLERFVPYEVEALEESVLVLTIAFEGHNAGQPGHGRS
jgi:quercetin dioxygenase-like cupin family protein